MAIIRDEINKCRKVKKRKPRERVTERSRDDFDLGFDTVRFYFLDEGEKISNVAKNYDSYGPAVLMIDSRPSSPYWEENHINDPKVWAYIRRIIAEGWINKDTMIEGPVMDERHVVYS